jgi:hypothetical protein
VCVCVCECVCVCVVCVCVCVCTLCVCMHVCVTCVCVHACVCVCVCVKKLITGLLRNPPPPPKSKQYFLHADQFHKLLQAKVKLQGILNKKRKELVINNKEEISMNNHGVGRTRSRLIPSHDSNAIYSLHTKL